MIKMLLSTGVLCLLCWACVGQKINVGIKGGVNFQKGGISIPELQYNYHTGAFFKWDFCSKATFQVEGLYDLREWERDETSIQTTQVQVPVLLKYFWLKPIYIQAGAQGNYLIDLKENKTKVELPEDRLTYAALGGVGLCLPSGFDLSLRYLYPMSSSKTQNPGIQLALAFDIY